VSTILKSLKKLEQENRSPQHQSPFSGYHGTGSFPYQDAKDSRFKNIWGKGGLMAAVILLMCAAGIYYYTKNQDVEEYQAGLDNTVQPRPEVSSQKNVSPKRSNTPPSAANQIAPGNQNIAPRPVPSQAKNATAPKDMPPAPPTSHRSSPTAASKDPAAESGAMARRSGNPLIHGDNRSSGRNIEPQRPSPPKVTPGANTPAPPAQKLATRLPSPAKEKQPRKPSSESFQNVPVLSGGPLKVHAIVWSPVSEDRMAVINSLVLYEGDTVEGYTLLAIRADDVVVRKDGGGRFKVRFGRP
jgi:hypothetical protein